MRTVKEPSNEATQAPSGSLPTAVHQDSQASQPTQLQPAPHAWGHPAVKRKGQFKANVKTMAKRVAAQRKKWLKK